MRKITWSIITLIAVVCFWQLTVIAAPPVTDGLMLHLEADAIEGVNDGEAIAGWPATVGNDATIGGAAPTYVADSGGGMPAVEFADDGYIAFTRMADIRTVFWVLKEDSDANQDGFILGDGSVYHFHRDTDNGNLWHPSHTSVNIRNGVTRLNGSQIDGLSTKPPTSMGIVSVVTTGVVTASSFSNDRNIAGRGWDGLLAELLVYDRALSEAEENDVGYYLETKYGLSTSYTSPILYVSNYSPVDGAERVGQDVQLSWEAHYVDGTAVFDVYFSDDPNDVDETMDPNTPIVPITTTTDSFYSPPAALDPGTLYFWRIAVVDDVNTVPILGDILTFTTGGDVVGIYPADGAIGVPTDLTISWTGDAEGSTYIDEYEIYLGETLPETPTATVTETQWQAPELADSTTYQCKIVSMHLGSPVGDATISFATGALVGYWPFDDNLTDTVGTNDGTLDDPVFAEGVINESSAVQFSGADGQEPVRVPIPDISTGGNWAISLWEYSNPDIGGGWETIMGNGGGTYGWEEFEFGRFNFNRYVLGINEANYWYTANDNSYLRGGWQSHVLSYDSTARVLSWYINGLKVHDYTSSTMVLYSELCVGNVSSTVQPFVGRVDDLKVYTRPLTDGQVLQAFIDDLAGKPYNPNPAVGIGNIFWDTVLEWRFAETPDSAVIEIGMEPDLSDATEVALTGDFTSFDTYAGLGIHLTPSTGYYWRVSGTYSGDTVVGPTWYFVVRDLLGDTSGDLKVGVEDFSIISAKWQYDTFVIIPGGEEYPYVDQEDWVLSGDGDPNLADFDAYVVPGGPWGESLLTVKTDPTPPDSNDFTPPSQTLLWTAWGEAGQQQLCGLVFPKGVVNFNDFDRFGFWCYQRGTEGNFEFRPITPDGVRPITKTVWGMGVNNDKWYNYEWEIGGDAPDIYKVDIWVGDNEFTIEYGNFYLVKDGVEVPLCFEENWFNEDVTNDCIVNVSDLVILAEDWMLNASN